MEGHDATTCRDIVLQDRENYQVNGVGNALAQAYNHTILPLASYRDKVTQVAWGIADFEHRFNHKPQGMWLPETAVDLETLCVLADSGIQFTILAPWQVEGQVSNANQPFRVELPGGRGITIFLYDAELSGGISFNPELTLNADRFAVEQIRSRYHAGGLPDDAPQLVLIATDGELYGHHQRLREHFLAHLVDGASTSAGLHPTYPGLWLRSHPPRTAIKVRESTSWSCHHGVSRWIGDCDCTPEARWKFHLRSAFDQLAAQIDKIYEEVTSPHIHDPWSLRNQYIHVLLGRLTAGELVDEFAGHHLPDETQLKIHLLLAAQHARQRMYTSCGWFFDDFDRIEPQNNLASAAQAVRLVRAATGVNLEGSVLGNLSRVISRRTGLRSETVFLYHLRRTLPETGFAGADSVVTSPLV
jgi:hypothetical protein